MGLGQPTLTSHQIFKEDPSTGNCLGCKESPLAGKSGGLDCVSDRTEKSIQGHSRSDINDGDGVGS